MIKIRRERFGKYIQMKYQDKRGRKKMELLKWLEEWYQAECNGDWEHCYGVRINTVDNPGWWVEIDIEDTSLREKEFETIRKNINDDNWMICRTEDGKFIGDGDPSKLATILQIFKDWVES